MGFWAKLLGREQDTTVTDFQARANAGGPFRLVIEDVFTITGRGTVVTGTVESGSVSVGDVVTLTGAGGQSQAQITGVEAFRKRLTTAAAGEHVGLLLDGVARDDVERGTVISR